MLLLLIAVNIIQLLLLSFAAFVAFRTFAAIKQQLFDFFSPIDGGLSPFGKLIGTLSADFAAAIVKHIKMSLLGQASVDSKLSKAIEGDIVTDIATQNNPAIGMILEQFPSLRRRLQKHPEYLPMIQGAISSFIGKGNGKPTPQEHGEYADLFKNNGGMKL
jgi:hypothetical protein